RRAVESAARAARLPARDRLTVARAFDRHGLRPGWERRIPTDSRVLADGLTVALTPPGLAGGRHVVPRRPADGPRPTHIGTGRTGGGGPVRLSENDDLDDLPATDGRRAVWVSMRTGPRLMFRVLSRPLDRRAPETVLHESPAVLNGVAVVADTVSCAGTGPA